MEVRSRVTTQDISWFLDLESNGQLDLDPPYQRRSVWSAKDRRFFLDTIFRGYPSPSIFLHKQVIENKPTYFVVDGKQRLETILRFAKNKIVMDKDYGDTRLAGKRWKSIKEHDTLARAFWDYILPVEFTDIIDDTNLINEVFDRLNRNSRKLVEQELRHAKFSGWFITFVESESDSPDWRELGVATTSRAKRMRDVQFLSELLIVLLRGKVDGFDQEEITQFYADYDVLSDSEHLIDEPSIRQQFADAKNYLLKLERDASIVTTYARDFNNLYSLWAAVVLNAENLPDAGDFLDKYARFMDEVNKYKNEDFLEMVISGGETASFVESLSYYQNSTGASTEPRQRQERNDGLLSALFGV